MAILQLSDFRGGKYDIPDAQEKSTNKADVQEFIDKNEKPYLNLLLGVALAKDMLDYIAASKTPAQPLLNFILDPFSYQPTNSFMLNNTILESKGLKEFLKACVYYEYEHNGLKTSQAGVADINADAAVIVSPAATARFAQKMFNDQLDTKDAIQQYCMINSSDYPTFNGVQIDVKGFI